jgi:hypothetical protein
MRNFLSALARALKGTVLLPFWLAESGWNALKSAYAPRSCGETDYAAEEAQQVVEATKEPAFDELTAVVAALRVIVYNSKQDSYDYALPMRLDGLDDRWCEWLSRLDAPSAQRAYNAENCRPGALEAHRSGEMKMLGIPRVKSAQEYTVEAESDIVAAREEICSQTMNFTAEQDAALLKPLDDIIRGVFALKC